MKPIILKTKEQRIKPLNKLSYHLILIQSSLRVLSDQVDQLSKTIEKNKINPYYTKATVEKQNPSHTETPTDSIKPEKSIMNSVYDKIEQNHDGIAISHIKKKTGFSRIQVANAIYKLKIKKMIKAINRGVYTVKDRSIK